MQRGLVCPQVDLCVGKFRDVPGGTKSLLVSYVRFNDRALLGTVDVSTPLPDVIGWVSRMVLASCG